MDEKPIATSSRLLLVAGGPVENAGQTWNTAGTDVTAWGKSPTFVETVQGSITLRQLQGARAVSVQPLDGAGQPFGASVEAVGSGGDWKAKIGDNITTWYQITVAR